MLVRPGFPSMQRRKKKKEGQNNRNGSRSEMCKPMSLVGRWGHLASFLQSSEVPWQKPEAFDETYQTTTRAVTQGARILRNPAFTNADVQKGVSSFTGETHRPSPDADPH